ncbi:MAG: ribonuclease HI family protein [bacterium]
MIFHAHTDGASRGNPGEAGIGITIRDDAGRKITSLSGYIGIATNNVAEYTALLACLKAIAGTPCTRLIVHSDSELMVRQLNGKYKVKDSNLKTLFSQAQRILRQASFDFEIRHIPREENKEADRLANFGIDSKKSIKI